LNKIWLNYWVFSVWKSVNITAVQFSFCCSSSSNSFTLPIAWKKPNTQNSPIGYLNCRTLSLPPFTSLTSIFNIFVPSFSLSLLAELGNPFLFPSQTITFIDICMQDIEQMQIPVWGTNSGEIHYDKPSWVTFIGSSLSFAVQCKRIFTPWINRREGKQGKERKFSQRGVFPL